MTGQISDRTERTIAVFFWGLTTVGLIAAGFSMFFHGQWKEWLFTLGAAAFALGALTLFLRLLSAITPFVIDAVDATWSLTKRIVRLVVLLAWKPAAIAYLLFSGSTPLMIIGFLWALHLWFLTPLLRALRSPAPK